MLHSKTDRPRCTIDTFLTPQEVSMPQKKIVVQPVRAVQTNLFRPLNQSSPNWNHMPEAVKGRLVEALAQVLLRASGTLESKEALDE